LFLSPLTNEVHALLIGCLTGNCSTGQLANWPASQTSPVVLLGLFLERKPQSTAVFPGSPGIFAVIDLVMLLNYFSELKL